MRFERREHRLENPLVNLRPQPLPNHAQTAVIGRALFKPVAQKRPHREAVLTARRDRTFAAQVFEKTYHEHFQIHHRINPGSPAPALFAIRRRTQRPDLSRKIHLRQVFVELAITWLWGLDTRALSIQNSPCFSPPSRLENISASISLPGKMASISTVC